jgi:hypothetical protein
VVAALEHTGSASAVGVAGILRVAKSKRTNQTKIKCSRHTLDSFFLFFQRQLLDVVEVLEHTGRSEAELLAAELAQSGLVSPQQDAEEERDSDWVDGGHDNLMVIRVVSSGR